MITNRAFAVYWHVLCMMKAIRSARTRLRMPVRRAYGIAVGLCGSAS